MPIRDKECYIDSKADIKNRNLSLLIDKINNLIKKMKNSNSFCLIFICVITQRVKSALYMIMLKIY